MSRRPQSRTRSEFCRPLTRALREFGYPELQNETVKRVLDAFIEGKRGKDLPEGVIGVFVGGQLDAIEAVEPGGLARLVNE